MAIVQISKMQQRAGNLVDLPQLDNGELGWASDANRLFIGRTGSTYSSENIEVLTSYSNISLSQITGSYGGNLNINMAENGQVLTFVTSTNTWENYTGNSDQLAGGKLNLGDPANITMAGGAIGYVLQTDGTGNLSWTAQTGGGGVGSPGGANTSVQFNDAGIFGGSANLSFNKISRVLNVVGNVVANNFVGNLANGTTSIRISPTSGNLTFTTAGNTAMTITTVANVGIGTTSPTAKLDVNGNIAITAPSARITGDFSNATAASRVSFQTSTVNGGTIVQAMPNGTGTFGLFRAVGSSDPDNASVLTMQAIQGGTQLVTIRSDITGTGTYLPMTFYTSGTEKLRIAADTTGTYTFGGTAPRITGDFSNATIVNRVLFQTSTTNSQTAVGILPNGTANTSNLLIYSSSSDPANSSVMQMRVGGDGGLNGLAATITGTGSYLPLMFWTGGSERMRLDTSGNLGIGTTTPSTYGKFGVVSGSNYFGIAAGIYNSVTVGPRPANDGYASLTYSWSTIGSGNFWVNDYSSGGIDWVRFSSGVGGGTLMRIDSSGNLYVGDTATTIDGTITIGSNGAGSVAITRTGTGATNSAMTFSTTYSTLQERMRISSVGDVLIGSSATAGNTLRYLDVYNTDTGASAGSIIRLVTSNVAASGTTTVDIVKYKAGGFLINNNDTNAAVYTAFGVGASERMRIDYSGNVGIGTSSPAYPLDVYSAANGIVRVKGGSGTSQGAAFYVTAAGSGNTLMAMGDSARIIGGTVDTTAMVYANVPLVFHVNNAERMRINSSGNVGIGTSSPTQKLDVNGIGRMRFSSGTGAGHYLDTTGNASRFFVGTDAVTEAWRVYDTIGGANRIYLDSSGNVGIGTVPTYKFEVYSGSLATTVGSQSIMTRLATGVTNISVVDISSIRDSAGSDWNTAGSRFQQKIDSTWMGWMQFNGFENQGGLALGTGVSTSGPLAIAERMRIDSSGRVLINLNTSKTYGNQLQVVSAINAIGSSSADASLVASYDFNALDSSPTYSSAILRKYGSTAAGTSYFTSTIAAAGWAEIGGINVQGGVVFGANGAVPLVFANSAERMRIDSFGRVGIGTIAPTGQLDVRTAAGVVAQSNLYTGSNAAVVKFNIGQVGSIDWDVGLTATTGDFLIGGLGGSMAEAYRINRTGTSINYQTWNTNGTERMRITSTGALSFGSSGTNYGSSGQVLTSQGNGPPTWTTVASGGGTVTSVGGTGTVNGISLSGTVTTTGSLTLSGSLSGSLSGCTVDGTNSVGYLNIPQNSQGSSYTLVAADSGKHIYHATAAPAATYTIPANSSVAFALGTAISFVNFSNAVLSIACGDTMYLAGTGTTGTRSLAQWGTATAIKVQTTGWVISGTGLT